SWRFRTSSGVLSAATAARRASNAFCVSPGRYADSILRGGASPSFGWRTVRFSWATRGEVHRTASRTATVRMGFSLVAPHECGGFRAVSSLRGAFATGFCVARLPVPADNTGAALARRPRGSMSPTSTSLLQRLRDTPDPRDWQRFVDLYR